MAVRRNVARRPVDWDEVRSRLEAVGRALSGAMRIAPEHVRVVLEQRARALARPVRTPAPIDELEAVTFVLANEGYALESRYVFEVFRLEDLSPLPGAKPPIFGVTAWRGELLTILDLRTVLGLPVTALNDLSRVLVLGTDRPAFGILVDAVHDVVRLPGSEVRQLPEGVAAKRDYLRGVTTNAVLVLDAEQVLRL